MTDTILINETPTTSVIISGVQGPPGPNLTNSNVSLVGDIIGTGTLGTDVTTSLSPTGVIAGEYGSSSKIPVVIIDSKGRVTGIEAIDISVTASDIVGILPNSIMPAFSGDITTTEGSAITSLKASGVTAGSYSLVTVNSKGIVTEAIKPTLIADLGISNVFTKSEVETLISGAAPEITFASITNKPNTLQGYGIIDGVNSNEIGTSIATLVDGKIPSTQLPSYVDDTIEVATYSTLPTTGEGGKIYITVDTNKTYRWTGSNYVEIGGTTTDASALISGTLNYQRLPALTGDVLLTQGSNLTALNPTGVTAGIYGSASKTLSVSVDTKGRLSNVIESNIYISLSNISDSNTKQDTLTSGVNIKSINGYSILGSGNLEISTTIPTYDLLPEASGTASAGTVTNYSRGDHRHPKDSTKQDTLVDGYNIKTINNVSILGSGNLAIQVGSAETLRQVVVNSTGSALTKGQVVYINGSNGTNVTISLAKADAELTSSKTLGLLADNINNGASGFVITEGILTGIDTSAATNVGDAVWLSSTVAGGLVFGASPAQPAHSVYLGVVSRKNANNGEILIKVQNGYELSELHNVLIPSAGLVNEDLLTWESTTSLWKNKQLSSGQVTTALGFTPYNSTNPAGYTSNLGTVTSVSGAGTVSGLTLSGTVTSAGSLTLSGAITGFLALSGGTMTGALAMTDSILSGSMFKDVGYSYHSSGTTNALDYVNGSHQRWTPNTGAQTLSIANWPPSGNLGELLIEGVNLGAATITWPTINWIKSDGTTTTTFSSNGVTLQASGTDWVLLWTRDAGTTIYGKVVR